MSTEKPHAERPCPCGSGQPYAQCCAPYHRGEAEAPTAEVLMRSRYTAYTLGLVDYLLATWAAETRPATLALDDADLAWVDLTIVGTRGGGADEAGGEVEFVARALAGDRLTTLHETSRFVREHGAWRYLDGDLAPDTPTRVGRNAPCPCGSGRKFKRCHGA